LCELAQLVDAGKASCREVTEAFLDRSDQLEGRLGAFVSLRREEALREAEDADRLRARGEVRSRWHGLPLAVKDILVSPNLETTCGSRILRGFRAPYESTVLGRVREAGMVVIGTTNMDEFAMGSSCENSAHGVTANPWDLSRVPGGSSGGSAAAVAPMGACPVTAWWHSPARSIRWVRSRAR
jgi:aspartyl-tRNA(Asn)/glutamyl-tRNA(Gln) amidotransferase subunit A